jgi:hypothetical protein
MHPNEGNNWKLATRVTHYLQPIFKLKQTGSDQLIMHLPKRHLIQTCDFGLRESGSVYTFSTEIQAIEQFCLEGQTYVAAGAKNGAIEVQKAGDPEKYALNPLTGLSSQHAMINDMLYLGDGRLINCYNNGCLAIWNLAQTSKGLLPASYTKVHQSWTYKIRRMDP